MKEKKKESGFLLKICICFALLIIASLLPKYSNESFATVQDSNEEFCYLSDIEYIKEQSSVGWGSITLDRNLETKYNKGLIALIINGEQKTFMKGVSAHAISTLVYDVSELGYDYFSTYYGVDASRGTNGNGVKFAIYTSTDGENWDLHTLVSPPVKKGDSEAEFITVDIRGKKYIKLYAHNNGNATADHAVYADAKLYKEGYEEDTTPVSFIKTVAEYDEIIKRYNGQEITGEYEKTLLQREFVKNVGYDVLQFLAKYKVSYRETLEWLMNDSENLRLYVLGGTPEGGSYYNSLIQLFRLYNEYSDDFTKDKLLNNEWCPEGMTNGDLYKKMAITLSLTHSNVVGLWMQASAPENKSDALRRYAIYKYMYENGMLNASLDGNWDMTKWFEALQVEEMRFIMNNLIDDEEIIWLNRYVQKNLDQYKQGKYLTPHPYMAYVWPNYQNNVYYDEENKAYFNELFSVNGVGLFDLEFTIPGGKNNPTYKLKVTRGTPEYKLYKVWMNFRNKFGTGAVCGGISKSGSNIRATHGIPATVIGQPGHAALLYYTKDTQGRGYWGIDNDVSGWTLSEKGERMLLGWGNASYSRGYSVVYMVLAQEVLNDYENFEKCEKTVMLAKAYEGDLRKQEEIYREALEIQPINIDAWYGLINVYLANENKTENDFYNLAEELAEELKYFPLPMYHLTNLIKPRLTSIENSYRFTLLQTRMLNEASVLPNNTADSYTVYQPGVTRVEANYLLGIIDKTIATFSFDGEDAGKIVLSSRFDENGIRWDYSIDGKQNWIEVSFTADEEHKLQLTKEQIASITAENDIYVHIVGVNYDENNLYKIDITEQSNLPNLFANDLENRVVGVNLSTEWRYTENDEWTSYSVSSPDLTGNKTVQVRQPATGTKLTSPASDMFTFTADNQPDTRKYIPVSHLSIDSVSTEATSHAGGAINAIDGNYNTRWHSAWNGTDTQRFIVIKLDKPVNLSAVEFVPAGGGNGKIYDGTIYGSIDGENWEELTSMKNITYTNQANTIEDAKANTKSFEIENSKEVQYVKIVADRTNGNWFTAREFNLYQDITKNPHPTAGIGYSTTEPTNGIVVARLINPSTKITITNNDGKDTYVFTKNGEFTFEFEDENGNTGSSVAKVDWIDEDAPTVDVDYKLNGDKKLLILLDNISEDVYLLDENNNKINYVEVKDNKVSNISYLDAEGNIYKVVDVGENNVINKITYKNTTGDIASVKSYVTILENGEVIREEYLDGEGNSVTVTDSEKQDLRKLQQAIANPLEYVLETSGDYEFRLLDKASNIAYKSIKVDYIDNDTTILASDITYDITKLTNKNVTATINPYIINNEGQKIDGKVINNNGKNTYVFEDNGKFTFEYKDASDTDNLEVKEHIAKVDWIDTKAPKAEIKYSTREGAVVATLVNESEAITITNNGSSREYTFYENDEFTFEFQDKAGNTGRATAKVDWLGQEIIFESEKYKIEEEYISRVVEGTTVAKFKENIETNRNLTFIDKDGNVMEEDDIVTTNAIVRLDNGIQYNIVVIGDVDCDGEVTIKDISIIKKHIIDIKKLTGASLKAADVDADNECSIRDISQIKKILIGLLEIK